MCVCVRERERERERELHEWRERERESKNFRAPVHVHIDICFVTFLSQNMHIYSMRKSKATVTMRLKVHSKIFYFQKYYFKAPHVCILTSYSSKSVLQHLLYLLCYSCVTCDPEVIWGELGHARLGYRKGLLTIWHHLIRCARA